MNVALRIDYENSLIIFYLTNLVSYGICEAVQHDLLLTIPIEDLSWFHSSLFRQILK
jgi:hypothetical protein